MPRPEVLHSGPWLSRRRRRGYHAIKPHKRRHHLCPPLHHPMRRFPDRHHAQFFEIPQIDSRFTAHQQRSLAPQLPLHRRRNIDRRQRFVENLPGQLLQVRHERSAWKFFTMPSELLDSKCSAAVFPRTGQRHFPPRCTPFLFASPAKPTQCAAPAPHSPVSARDESTARSHKHPAPRPRFSRPPAPPPPPLHPRPLPT